MLPSAFKGPRSLKGKLPFVVLDSVAITSFCRLSLNVIELNVSDVLYKMITFFRHDIGHMRRI